MTAFFYRAIQEPRGNTAGGCHKRYDAFDTVSWTEPGSHCRDSSRRLRKQDPGGTNRGSFKQEAATLETRVMAQSLKRFSEKHEDMNLNLLQRCKILDTCNSNWGGENISIGYWTAVLVIKKLLVQ